MKRMGIALAAGALSCLSSSAAMARPTAAPQPVPSSLGPLYHPDGPGGNEWRLGVGAQLDILPRLLVEAEMRLVPRLTVDVRYGLPAGFSADASFGGNVFANELRLGAAWSTKLGPASLLLYDRMGVFFGAIGVSGFDTSVWGLNQVPGVGLGVRLGDRPGDSYLSLRSELVINLKQSITFGEETVSPQRFPLAAWSNVLRVETPLGNSGLIFYGADLLYAVADQQLWIVFSDARGRLFFPRFSVGYAR